MTTIEMTKKPGPAIGPVRDGAGKALFYWSWFMVLAQHFHFSAFVTYTWYPIGYDHESRPWDSPYFILAPYLAGAVIFSLLGALIKWSLAKRTAKKPKPAVSYGEVYAQSFAFVKGHWKSLILISLPVSSILIFPGIYYLWLYGKIDFFIISSPISFAISLSIPLLIIYLCQLALMVYYNLASESLEIKAGILVKNALTLFLVSFVAMAALLEYSLLAGLEPGTSGRAFWGLDKALLALAIILHFFMSVYLALYIIKGQGLIGTLKTSARFLAYHFFKTVKFALFIALKTGPLVYLILLYAFWVEFVSFNLLNDAKIIGSDFFARLIEVLLWPANQIYGDFFWIFLAPAAALAYLWLTLAFMIFIKKIDHVDRTSVQESGPLSQSEALADNLGCP